MDCEFEILQTLQSIDRSITKIAQDSQETKQNIREINIKIAAVLLHLNTQG